MKKRLQNTRCILISNIHMCARGHTHTHTHTFLSPQFVWKSLQEDVASVISMESKEGPWAGMDRSIPFTVNSFHCRDFIRSMLSLLFFSHYVSNSATS